MSIPFHLLIFRLTTMLLIWSFWRTLLLLCSFRSAGGYLALLLLQVRPPLPLGRPLLQAGRPHLALGRPHRPSTAPGRFPRHRQPTRLGRPGPRQSQLGCRHPPPAKSSQCPLRPQYICHLCHSFRQGHALLVHMRHRLRLIRVKTPSPTTIS